MAILICLTGTYFYLTQFNSTKWQDAKPWHKRIMVKDLRNDYNIIGMPKSDIIKLLGESEAGFGDDDLYYHLGSGLIMSEIYLHIEIEDDIAVGMERFVFNL